MSADTPVAPAAGVSAIFNGSRIAPEGLCSLPARWGLTIVHTSVGWGHARRETRFGGEVTWLLPAVGPARDEAHPLLTLPPEPPSRPVPRMPPESLSPYGKLPMMIRSSAIWSWMLAIAVCPACGVADDAPAVATEPAETALAATPVSDTAVGGADWTYWRGPQMNGNSTETGLPESWDPEGGDGSNLLWKKEELGSRSTPIVMNGRVYIICRDKPFTQDEGEKLVCADAATGQIIWEQRWNAYLTEVPDSRLAWSAVVGDPETGYVYALGICGIFQCFKGDTGELVWAHSMHEEYGLLSTYGGRTNFPIVYEDLVIINAVFIGWGEQAKPTHRYIAFDKYNGQTVWFEGTKPFPEDTTYSAPVIGNIGGQPVMCFAAGDGGLYGFQPRTGKKLWSYQLSERGINTSPLIYKDYVICGHSEENIGSTEMGGLVCVNGKDGTEVWKTLERFVGKAPPIIAGDVLVVIEDGGKLFLMDPLTGKEFHSRKVDTIMRGSPLYADGKLYILTANGRWWIYKIVSEGEGDARTVTLEEVHKLRLNNDEGHGSPIASHGRIYIPTITALHCIGLKDAVPQGGALPEMPAESPRADDQTPAWVQVVPVEGLLYPGDSQTLDVRLYNAKGQWIRNADASEVTFTVEGAGTIGPQTYLARYLGPDGVGREQEQTDPHVYTTDGSLREHAAGIITAKVGELTGAARVRVVPNLPWSYDFNGGSIPINWVGIRYRHVPLDFELFQKLTTDDVLAGQLYIYFTSEFVNFAPQRSFDDTTAAMRWTELLRFLNLLGEGVRPKTLEAAQAALDASLQRLVDAQVLKSFTWSTWDRTDSGGTIIKEPKLEIAKGDFQVSGNGVMCKIQTIPKGTRSQGWIGHPTFKGYTVQADVFTPGKNGKMPDIGLINQRYTLDLQGASQVLQIRSWQAQLYYSQTVPFTWEMNTWYTMKFESSVDGQNAILKGKVWKKGDAEPAEWTVTVTDPIGNLQGSPGFFGSAKDAEIFYDNVTVTLNQPAATVSSAPGAE
jgi:outer membrane protein assembly factor BamB